jgi:hypothetical protein
MISNPALRILNCVEFSTEWVLEWKTNEEFPRKGEAYPTCWRWNVGIVYPGELPNSTYFLNLSHATPFPFQDLSYTSLINKLGCFIDGFQQFQSEYVYLKMAVLLASYSDIERKSDKLSLHFPKTYISHIFLIW